MLKLIKGKIHYFFGKGKTLVEIHPYPTVTKVIVVTKTGMEQKDLRPSQWCRNIMETASRKEKEMVSGNTCDLSDL